MSELPDYLYNLLINTNSEDEITKLNYPDYEEEKIPSSPTNSLKYISRQSSPINFKIPDFYYVCTGNCTDKIIDQKNESIWVIKCDCCLAYQDPANIQKQNKLYFCKKNCFDKNNLIKCSLCKHFKPRKNMKKVSKEKIKIV